MIAQLRSSPLLLPAVATAATVVALGLALAGAREAGARSQAGSMLTLRAPLSATQETPAPTGDLSAARGLFSATAAGSDDGGAVLTWQLTFSGLTGPAAAAHIHIAPRGQAGPVAVPLCSPCESGASGTANVDASVLQALQTGAAYANVHTAANPAGEIRGQVGVTANVRAALVARQEVPRPKGQVGRSRGTFTATVTREGATGSIAWRLTFAGLTGRALAAHIHLGARGKAGRVLVSLCGRCRSGARKVTALQASALNALESGRAYVNIHTARNPAGEVRGQIPAVPLRITP